MEHGWAFWWIIPMLMFFWWGPRHRKCARQRDALGNRQEPDDETRARLAAVDQLESRVSELENRLDFTERLLADRAAADSSRPAPASRV